MYLYVSGAGASLKRGLFLQSSGAKSRLICIKAEKPAQFHSTITPYSPLIQAHSIFYMLHTLLIYPLSSEFRPDGGNQLSPPSSQRRKINSLISTEFVVKKNISHMTTCSYRSTVSTFLLQHQHNQTEGKQRTPVNMVCVTNSRLTLEYGNAIIISKKKKKIEKFVRK